MPNKATQQQKEKSSTATTKTGGKKEGEKKKVERKKGPRPIPSALFEKRPKQFGISRIPPKKDLTRFVRWPKYIRLQRQRKILMLRMKVPPPINQFTKAIDKNNATALFKLLSKYKPETHLEKRKRLRETAKTQEKGEAAKPTSKPKTIKFGLNHVTRLIEKKKARLVVIAHDVDPIELVVWLPALCRKKDVPYCIVKSKSRLGQVVHQKTATCLAITDVEKEDLSKLADLSTTFKDQYNNATDRRQWGGSKLSLKARITQRKKQKLVQKEQAKREQKS